VAGVAEFLGSSPIATRLAFVALSIMSAGPRDPGLRGPVDRDARLRHALISTIFVSNSARLMSGFHPP
jgi:hypothetical protein